MENAVKMPSVEHALAILVRLNESQGSARVADLAEALALPEGTVHGLLHAMLHAGFAARYGQERYGPGDRIVITVHKMRRP